MLPQRVRCSPLGGEEVVADVVDRIAEADTRGHRDKLVVEYEGHRYRVLAAQVTPV